MTSPAPTTTLVVMGVSGSGKTSVGEEVAKRLGWVFAEGDAFHPPENIAKMRAGIPLEDADRLPWLQRLAAWIGEREAHGENAVVTCSALKRSYRELLRRDHPSVYFVHVTASRQVLEQRLADREGHYMPASLLPSQLATLEPLQPDEPGVTLTDPGDVDAVVEELLRALPRPPQVRRGTP
jgi:gluconokinase